MTTKDEIAAFETFKFRIGQKVKTKYGVGTGSGLVMTRVLVESVAGIHHEYSVRHSPDTVKAYAEFELDETI